MAKTAVLTAYPHTALADVPLRISVAGLKENQDVTLRSKLTSEIGIPFYCIAHYVARDDGTVDLERDASVGGYFEGVEPMGLIWAMRVQLEYKRKYLRPEKKDVTTPFIVEFAVFDTHLYAIDDTFDNEPLAIARVERWYKSKNVKRIPISTQGIEGTMFFPEGGDRFPGVIDIFGSKPGVTEYRASLLASHGYVTLTLKYFNMDFDKPETYKVDMDYFDRATKFLSNQPKVQSGGIGVVGSSLGGTIALFMTSYFDDVQCAVSINGPVCVNTGDFFYRGRKWEAKKWDYKRLHIVDNTYFGRETLHKLTIANLGESRIDFHKSKADFLFLNSEDDAIVRWEELTALIHELMEMENKTNYEIVMGLGAGHIVDPPYCPFTPVTFVVGGVAHMWGGNVKDHAKAQEKFWSAQLEFLSKSLSRREPFSKRSRSKM